MDTYVTLHQYEVLSFSPSPWFVFCRVLGVPIRWWSQIFPGAHSWLLTVFLLGGQRESTGNVRGGACRTPISALMGHIKTSLYLSVILKDNTEGGIGKCVCDGYTGASKLTKIYINSALVLVDSGVDKVQKSQMWWVLVHCCVFWADANCLAEIMDF